MKHLEMILVAAFALVAFALSSVVYAQGVDSLIPPGNPRTWFATPIALGAVVKFAVDLIRKYILKSIDGTLVLVLAAVVAAVLTGVGVVLRFITSDPVGFAFGAFSAAVGLNIIANQIGGANAKAATVDPAVRSRSGL
jgi:hypothetical protein